MAHFAELDLNGVVLRVVSVNNSDCMKDGVEDEETDKKFCKDLLTGDWIQTSYHGSKRKRYAGKGYKYSVVYDAFIPPQPYESWTLDTSELVWVPPVSNPNDGYYYNWDEVNQVWVNSGIEIPINRIWGIFPLS